MGDLTLTLPSCSIQESSNSAPSLARKIELTLLAGAIVARSSFAIRWSERGRPSPIPAPCHLWWVGTLTLRSGEWKNQPWPSPAAALRTGAEPHLNSLVELTLLVRMQMSQRHESGKTDPAHPLAHRAMAPTPPRTPCHSQQASGSLAPGE